MSKYHAVRTTIDGVTFDSRIEARRYTELRQLPITFAEAALGADIKVPTLLGEPVTIRIPEGTPNGRVFRVKARGIPTPHGNGDLLVAVELVVPSSLSAAERDALEKFREAATSSPRDRLHH